MANPYPPNPGMQQMMQPQQPQMPPQGQRPKPAKQGTSRAVPVVVSAGLAVGVFCGLLFGVGVPEDATASPSTGNNVKPSEPDTTPVPTPSSTASKPASTETAAKPATPLPAAGAATGAGSATPAGAGSGSATTVAAATGSGATPAPGAGSGSATAAVAAPEAKKVKLIVEVKPDTIAETATITVDKVELTGGTMELELPSAGKKEVKVVVKASGYKTVEQKVDVEGDVTVKVELIKRSSGGGGTSLPRPKTGGGGKKPAGGGLIDL